MIPLSPTINYRVAFIINVLRFFGPPFVLAFALSHFTLHPLRQLHAALLYAALIPAYWTVKINYDTQVKKADAKRHGAVLAPQVRGRWPGNLDIVIRYGITLTGPSSLCLLSLAA